MSDPSDLGEPARPSRKPSKAEAPFDPFAPPEIDAGPESIHRTDADTEELRRRHLNTELSIKAIGILSSLGGIMIVWTLIAWLSHLPGDALPEMDALSLLLTGAIGLAYVLLGVSLIRLEPRARVPALVGCVIMIGLHVVATLIGPGGRLSGGLPGAWIHLIVALILGSTKAKTILSPAYREVIAQTTHIRQQPSGLMKVGIILLAAFVILGGIAALTWGAPPP